MITSEELLLLVYFITLFGAIGYWLILAKRLFKQLMNVHPEIYRSMGKPTLRDGGTGFQQNFSLIRYLVFRQYLSLNDPYLAKLSSIMRGLLIGLPIYFISFTILIIMNQQ